MEQINIQEESKNCSICGRPLQIKYEKDICPACRENELFKKVKDYIRSGNVTEHQVAEKFQIPLRQVRSWVQDGRIEYREVSQDSIQEIRCLSCGEPIAFGSYCQKCYKQKHTPKGTYIKEKEKGRMRFLE